MHFNCYYHYKVNILTNVKKYGLLNKNNNETNIKDIKNVIYITFRLSFQQLFRKL